MATLHKYTSYSKKPQNIELKREGKYANAGLSVICLGVT